MPQPKSVLNEKSWTVYTSVWFINKEKEMKRKPIAAPRRMFLVAAKFKSGAGVHRKSNKAIRRQSKVETQGFVV